MATRCIAMPRRVRTTEALVRAHQRGVWRHLRFLGAPPPLADDLTQETFLVLLRSPPGDLGDAALGAWLRGTARNLFRRSGRDPRAGLVLLDDTALEDAWLRLAGDGDGDLRLGALDACVAGLDPRSRRALELRYRDGASRDAMARELSVSAEGVKTLLRRIRDALRHCIEKRLRDEPT